MLDRRSEAETTGARETPAVATHSVRPDQPERPPLCTCHGRVPACDGCKRVAWFALFARPEGLEHIEVLPPEHPTVRMDAELTLAALGRVLDMDRLRVTGVAPSLPVPAERSE